MKLLIILLIVLYASVGIPEDNLTVTRTVSPPQWNVSVPDFNISSIHQFWQEHTFGLFDTVMGYLAVGSVFLKTRSISATFIAIIALLGAGWFGHGVYLVLSLLLFAVMMMLWLRSR